MQDSINTQSKVTLSQLVKPIYYKPIIISVVMRFLQQMTGITPILVYLEPIFAKSSISLLPRFGNTLFSIYKSIGFVNFRH